MILGSVNPLQPEGQRKNSNLMTSLELVNIFQTGSQIDPFGNK